MPHALGDNHKIAWGAQAQGMFLLILPKHQGDVARNERDKLIPCWMHLPGWPVFSKVVLRDEYMAGKAVEFGFELRIKRGRTALWFWLQGRA